MNGASGPERESLLKFPCSFPIKVVGRHEPGFEALVLALVRAHVGEIRAEQVRRRASATGRFLSLTVTVDAQSREQLDDLYRTLTSTEQVLFVL
jgi:putative lipoic acid-binding regulatory protein